MSEVHPHTKQWPASGQGPEGRLMVQNIKCECENMRRAVTPCTAATAPAKGGRSAPNSQQEKARWGKKKPNVSCRLLSVTAVPVFSPSKSSIRIKVLIVFKGKCRKSLLGLKSQPPVCPIQLQTGHQTSMLSFLGPRGSCQCYFPLPDTLQWTWQSSTLMRVSYSELLRWTSRGAAIKLSPQLHHHRADCPNQAN